MNNLISALSKVLVSIVDTAFSVRIVVGTAFSAPSCAVADDRPEIENKTAAAEMEHSH
jgi:hypothetical protein